MSENEIELIDESTADRTDLGGTSEELEGDQSRPASITNEEAVAKGVLGLPDLRSGGFQGVETIRGQFAARARKMVEYFRMLQGCLAERDFDVDPILTALYGRDHNPDSEEGLIICIQCQRLGKKNGLTEDEFKELLRLVAAKARDALEDYTVYLDQATMPEAACVARLKQRPQDRAMSLHGERLRQAIDRKQWVITGLLRALGLTPTPPSREDERRDKAPPLKFCKTNPTSPLKSTKPSRKTSKTNPNKRLKTP